MVRGSRTGSVHSNEREWVSERYIVIVEYFIHKDLLNISHEGLTYQLNIWSRSDLLVEEIKLPWTSHQSFVTYFFCVINQRWQSYAQILLAIGTDYIDKFKPNNHTVMNAKIQPFSEG